MRIDKYLWCIRVFKTRSLATKFCQGGKVWVQGENIKASRVLKGGEKIDVRKGSVTYSFQVIDFPKSRVGAALVNDYVRDITAPEELEKLEMIKLANREQQWYGLGRPTKKNRRTLSKFLDDESDED